MFVVGGANSAGQSAIELASHGARITLLCREASLAEKMSDYLVNEIGSSRAITVRPDTEVVEGPGEGAWRA